MNTHPSAQDRMPLVSVVVATYERPDYLNAAVASVCGQTFSDYELIVVDDCSPEEAVEQYKLPDSGRLIRLDKHTGCASAVRNVGISHARGKYIALLDDDDLWMPDKLASQVRVLEENPEYGLTFSPVLFVDGDLNVVRRQPIPRFEPDTLVRTLVRGNIIITPSSALVRREAFEVCGGFNEELFGSEDWEMWVRAACRFQFRIDETPHTMYRFHTGQKSKRGVISKMRKVRAFEAVLDSLRQERPELVGLAHRRMTSVLRRLARLQMNEPGGFRSSLRTLRQAAKLWPFGVTNYTLMLKAVWCAALRRFPGVSQLARATRHYEWEEEKDGG